MPGDVAVKGPYASVIGDNADENPSKGSYRGGVASQWVRQTNFVIGFLVKVSRTFGKDKIFVFMEM